MLAAAPGPDLDEAVTGYLVGESLLPTRSAMLMRERIAAGGVVMLVDALDEVPRAAPSADAPVPGKRLQDLLRQWDSACPHGARFVLTSRLAGYTPPGRVHRPAAARRPRGRTAALHSRGHPRGTAAWNLPPPAAQRLDQLLADPALAGMTRVPLLLALICSLATDPGYHDLPGTRAGIYEAVLWQFLSGRPWRLSGAPLDGKLITDSLSEARFISSLPPTLLAEELHSGVQSAQRPNLMLGYYMRVLTSRRYVLSRRYVSVIAGLALFSVMATLPTSAPSVKIWNLTTDFARHPKLNPAPDGYGHKRVWSWDYGKTGKPNTFKLDDQTDAIDPACHISGVYQWVDKGNDPFGAYVSGSTINNICGENENWKRHTVVVSPGAEATGTRGVDAIIGWKSPISGKVKVSATIKGVNPSEQGVTWALYQGAKILVRPRSEAHDSLATITKSVTVEQSQSLYLEISSGGNDGNFDDCMLTFTIKT